MYGVWSPSAHLGRLITFALAEQGLNQGLSFGNPSGYAPATPSLVPPSQKLVAAAIPTAKLMLFVQCFVVTL